MLLEVLRGEFKVFGDGLSFIQARIARMEPKLDTLIEDMAILKPLAKRNTRDIAKNTRDIASIDQKTGRIEKRLIAVEDRVTAVEGRVTAVESRPV